MSARNRFLAAIPYEVADALQTLGQNLRTARLRRNLTLEAVAQKLGTRRQVVADAERGKPTTGVAVYAGLLWVLDLTYQLANLAEPAQDEVGMLLERQRERIRARPVEPDDNDF